MASQYATTTDVRQANLNFYLDEEFVDWKAPTQSGLSIWLHACFWADHLTSPVVLQKLLGVGCELTEEYRFAPNSPLEWREWDGWSCLFFVVKGACNPSRSTEFEALCLLLRSSANPYARDRLYRTVFDVIEHEQNHRYSRYRRDLWYHALNRSGYKISYDRSRDPPYSKWYTPRHYRALCHLKSWDQTHDPTGFDEQIKNLVRKHPWTVDELLSNLF